MTSDERSAYESECLEQTRLFLERLVDEPSVPQKLREAKLTGSYPDTEISVRWYDTRFDKEKSRSYRLWRHALADEPVFERKGSEPEDAREPPSSVGLLISTWVQET